MPVPAQPALAVAIALDGRHHYHIAAEANISPNVLGGILSGRVTPSPSVCERLAEALGAEVGDLFPGVVVQ
jgi:transcriptional regulator with XRE-family HTH domain